MRGASLWKRLSYHWDLMRLELVLFVANLASRLMQLRLWFMGVQAEETLRHTFGERNN